MSRYFKAHTKARRRDPAAVLEARRAYDALHLDDEPSLLPQPINPVAPDGSVICPICKQRTDDKVADHCHESGSVRDWLCRRCNAGLGMFKDNPRALRAAAAYIERHKAHPRDAVAFALDEQCARRTHERRSAKALAENLP